MRILICVRFELTPSFQECPFEGVESCLSRPHSCPCTLLESPESHPESNLVLPPPTQINVCTLSTDCCEITWSRLDSAAPLKNVPLPTEMNKTNGIDVSCNNLRPKVKELNNIAPPLLKGILKQRSYSGRNLSWCDSPPSVLAEVENCRNVFWWASEIWATIFWKREPVCMLVQRDFAVRIKVGID